MAWINYVCAFLIFVCFPCLIIWAAHRTDEDWIVMDNPSYKRTHPWGILIYLFAVILMLIAFS